MTKRPTILLTGAGGQIGIELTAKLRALNGADNIIATDLRDAKELAATGPFEILDVTDKTAVQSAFDRFQPTEVYHLASLLSATSEQKPSLAWKVNMDGLLHILECCKGKPIKLFWPSSIAVFGPGTPRIETPQNTIIDPNTIYGIGKLAGERWCEWYHNVHGLDVRSLRYPGLISYKAMPGGGTTDYAVDIFFKAIEQGNYHSYLKADTTLPMMFMDDAIRGTLELMNTPIDQIKTRSSYNFTAMSFSVEELVAAIKKHIPTFTAAYESDFRQAIADSWPASIDDSRAQIEWGWKPEFDIDMMVELMLNAIRQKVKA